MANHASAEKRYRQDTKRKAHNRVIRGKMRTAIKAVFQAADEGKRDEAKGLVGRAVTLVDRAFGKGIIKRHTASRMVSRLTRSMTVKASAEASK